MIISPQEIDNITTMSKVWKRETIDGLECLQATFLFPDFAQALKFVVAVGELAERRSHHPDLHLTWARVTVSWTTRDQSGVTALDFLCAQETLALVAKE